MFRDYADAAQFQEQWEAINETIRPAAGLFAGECSGDWRELGFTWHQGNDSYTLEKNGVTLHVYDDETGEIIQGSEVVFLKKVGLSAIANLIELIEMQE